MVEEENPARGLRFRREISIEHLIGLIAVILSVISFLISEARDRELLVKGQAQQLRASASDTLAQISRLEAISEFFFLQIEPLAVESSQALSDTRRIETARDILWHGVTREYVENEERFFNNRFSEFYYTIAAAYPALHDQIEDAMSELRHERRRVYGQTLSATQADVLAFAGRLEGYQSEALGNQLRQTMMDIQAEHIERVRTILTPVTRDLACIISKSDGELVYGPAETGWRPGSSRSEAAGRARGLGAICDGPPTPENPV